MSDCCKKEGEKSKLKKKDNNNFFSFIVLGVVLSMLLVSGMQAVHINNMKQNIDEGGIISASDANNDLSREDTTSQQQNIQQPPVMVGGC